MKRATLKHTLTALLVLLCISTAVMIYISNLNSTAFNRQLYEDKYDELDVYNSFPEGTDLTIPTEELITYMESGTGTLESDFFNDKEKAHMIEVRALFRAAQLILNIAVSVSMIVLLLIFALLRHLHLKISEKGIDKLLKALITRFMIWTGWIVNGIAICFAAIALTFSTSFIRFHEIFFRTDTWILNPATDNMINMFPQQFFFDLFIRVMLMSIIAATIMLAAGYVIRLGVPEKLKDRLENFR